MDALRMHLDFRNIWQQQSVNRRIFATMITVGGFTFVVNLAATAKELVVARQFGIFFEECLQVRKPRIISC